MRIVTTLIGFIIIVVVILNFSVSTDNNNNIYGQESNKTENTTLESTLYFKVEIPNDWAYEKYSASYLAELVGFGPLNNIRTMPSEYWGANTSYAVAGFQQIDYYTVRNAPLDLYEKYMIEHTPGMKVVSKKNVTFANEPSRQIYGEGIGEEEGFKFLQYYLFHNKEPYYIAYKASNNLYEKYLPDFEKMLKSFKWID
jgi:hypothetical protein